MSRIAHARGGRRVAILTGLLLGTFLAALIAGTCIGTLAAGIGGAIHRGALRSPVLDLPGEFLMAWGSSILDVSRLLFFEAPFSQVAILAWPFIAGLVVAPLLMVAPMVGMQGRRPSGIPLRWSIAGASMLGGLIALGVVLVPLDLVRLLVRHQGGVDPIRLMGEWNFYASMLALWAVAGLVWARVLARAGRHGPPDRVTRFVRWLFAGTCVELALAAPTYAMASRKSDCWCDWLA